MHRYTLQLTWTGNRGPGTTGYREYGRDATASAGAKPDLLVTADPAYRGDADRWNPEELLVAALAQCHLLWYLHLCSSAGVVVRQYTDSPVGELVVHPDGGGEFSSVTLHPRVVVAEQGMRERALALHAQAHQLCFIARSVAFEVGCEPLVTVE
ncbi:MAG TPA: OsmC family protein [Jatrophihabitans sp.]|nr:OsmC family protein [Jatrophihabitans sp.]